MTGSAEPGTWTWWPWQRPWTSGYPVDGSDPAPACREAFKKLKESYVSQPGHVVIAHDLATRLSWKEPRASLAIVIDGGAMPSEPPHFRVIRQSLKMEKVPADTGRASKRELVLTNQSDHDGACGVRVVRLLNESRWRETKPSLPPRTGRADVAPDRYDGFGRAAQRRRMAMKSAHLWEN